jgi:hypothetical protein
VQRDAATGALELGPGRDEPGGVHVDQRHARAAPAPRPSSSATARPMSPAAPVTTAVTPASIRTAATASRRAR